MVILARSRLPGDVSNTALLSGSKVEIGKKSVVADSVWVWIDHPIHGLRDGMLLVRSKLMDQRAFKRWMIEFQKSRVQVVEYND